MIKFLENHCKFLHKVDADKSISTETKANKPPNKSNYKQNNSNYSKQNSNMKSYAISEQICPLCKGGHGLYACPDFIRVPPLVREAKVRELKLCFNCLQKGHRNMACPLGPCPDCGRKHNKLSHPEAPVARPQPVAPAAAPVNDRACENSSTAPFV